MNLNKAQKEEIVRRVIADIPRTCSDPHTFQKEVDKIILRDCERQLPPQILALWLNKDTHSYIANASGSVLYLCDVEFLNRYETGKLEPYARCNVNRPLKCSTLHPKSQLELRELVRRVEAERETIEAAKTRLGGVLAGIRTRKHFLELLPELEKYLPPELTKSSMLPMVTNVVADLAKLGWPKTETVAA
jgi:hypothetical protein